VPSQNVVAIIVIVGEVRSQIGGNRTGNPQKSFVVPPEAVPRSRSGSGLVHFGDRARSAGPNDPRHTPVIPCSDVAVTMKIPHCMAGFSWGLLGE